MSLLEELQTKRQRKAVELADARGTAREWQESVDHLTSEVADLDLAISALTPPLQHKGGEPEVEEGRPTTSDIVASAGMPTDDQIAANVVDDHAKRIMCDSRCERLGWDAHRNGWSLDDCPGGDHTEAREWRNGWACREQHIRGAVAISEGVGASSEADSGPRSEDIAGDARIEQTISTLQASSGEGETTVSELGAADVDGVDAQTAGATLPDGGQESPDLLQESRCSVAGCEIHGTPPIAVPEPAAYSPVNNADEPFIDDTVAGSFARGKDRELELAAEADAAIEAAAATQTPSEPQHTDEGTGDRVDLENSITDPDADFFAKGFAEDAKRKAAEEKPGFRLFGGIGAFGKREVVS